MTFRASDVVPISEARARLTELAEEIAWAAARKVDARKLDYYHALEEEHAGLVLADAALEGLEDLAVGRIVDEAELDKALLSSAQAKKLRKV